MASISGRGSSAGMLLLASHIIMLASGASDPEDIGSGLPVCTVTSEADSSSSHGGSASGSGIAPILTLRDCIDKVNTAAVVASAG